MKIVNFILEKYVFLAFCTAGLTAFSYQAFAIPVDLNYVILVGLGTFVTYNYHEWLGKSMHELVKLALSPSGIVFVLVTLLLLFLSIRIDVVEALILLSSGILSILYFIGLRGKPTLRSTPWGKVLVIGIVFSLSTIVVPSIAAGYGWLPVITLSVARTLYIMALAISFDIGDQLVDYHEHSRTLPIARGVGYAKWVAIVALIVAIFIETYWAINYLIELPMLLALGFTYMLSVLLIFKSNRSKPRWYYLFLIDGMIGLPFLLSLVFRL